ncbi:MAG: ABC transporter permease [Syntrophaceticus sp.]|jgi:ABC-2 type transport system permease protein|nr:ABC transporter permease [Syntrophaceticus sp.]MDD4783642.1 ABC transporter permease [Syntrophaceticus sp.]
MFAHIFIYRLKCLLRDKETIFWTLLFPLLLAVFFNIAFANLNKGEIFKAIDIAIVDDVNYQSNQYFKTALNEASQGDDRLFNLTVASKEKADQLLINNSISGYIVVENPINLVVNRSGLNPNIIKSFIDNYMQTVSSVNSILLADPAKQQELLSSLGNRQQYIKEISGTAAEPNNILNYFYTLIAMACFYGGFLGMREITDIQADISPLAARINVAPVHKLKTIISSMSASLLIHLTEMLLLLIFLRFVLQVDFGSKIGFVILTTVIGSIAGVTFGALISALVKKSEGIKVAILIGVTMFGSFLAGMMYQNMKYIVAQKIPVLSYLNPVNLLTDAFYCLYYYDTFSRYALNMGILSIFIVIFCVGTYSIIRRRKYASL